MIKTLWAITLVAVTTFAGAAENSAPPVSVKGEVLEVRDVESYTYLRLKTQEGETWAAVAKAPVKKGSDVTIENVMVMDNFVSKTLKKTFKTILFGSLAGAQSSPVAPGLGMATSHAINKINVADIHVPRAVGENAKTVAEIVSKAVELKDKPVLVRGKIVKYNPGIMGKNWIHLRDGSAANTNGDILVTTTNAAKLGDIVTVKGVVRNDKDFGSGYFYKVLIEDAALQP
jgi:hypothetical protein